MRHNTLMDLYMFHAGQLKEPPMLTIYSYDPATCNQIHSIKPVHLNHIEQYLLERTALNPDTVFVNKYDTGTSIFIWKGPVNRHTSRQVKHWKHISYARLNPQLKAYMLLTQE